MASTATKLNVTSRTAQGSRATRRLRRQGRVPGVIYGDGKDPVGFDADARELRHALAGSGAVLDLSVDGAKATPVVLKEAQRHPVRGETIHVDLLRVRLDEEITAVVPSLTDGETYEPIFVRDGLGRPLEWTGALPPALAHRVDRVLPEGVGVRRLLERGPMSR